MQKLSNNEYGYLGNNAIKRDGVIQDFSKTEILEYQRCMKDPIYFAKKYVHIINLDDGLIPFNLYEYQEKMYKAFLDNRFNITLACRQSGKSISACIFLLWYALFKSEQTIAILANKGATAREMLGRITLALENLPFFLQPGCKAVNKGSLEFSNNSKIITASTSSSSIRGQSVNLLFLDEFAFIDNDASFYTSTYPVISSGENTKIIVMSTANGVGNVFHKLWQGATTGTNEFKPFRIDWWDVPGRDERWRKETIANTSELQFDQEFGNSFHGRGNTLIDATSLLKQKSVGPQSINDNIYIYQEPIEGHEYIMTVDVSKGRGQDYSTWSIIDISVNPFEQVCIFHDNNMSPLLFPDYIYKWATAYNKAYVIIESNDHGMIVCNGLHYDLEYDNMYVDSVIKSNALGCAMTARVKRIGCSTFKDLIQQKKLNVVHAETIKEMSTFTAKGSSYAASGNNHDDLIMNLILFSWFTTTDLFNSLTDINMKHMLYQEQIMEMQNDMLPFGIIADGHTHNNIENEVVGRDEEGDNWVIHKDNWLA